MADHYGITPDGFNIKRLPEIKADLDERINIALNNQTALLPDSPEGQLSGLFSIIYAQLWEELSKAYSAFNPLNVIEQDLDNLVLLNGITRLEAAPSEVTLTITGVEGTTIPASSIVSSSVSSAQFLTDYDVTIPATGSVNVLAHSRIFAVIVADAGDLTIIETPINGWVAATNDVNAVVGRLRETDAELRLRRARSLSLSGQSSLGSIFTAVGAIGGVSYVSVTENVTSFPSAVIGEQPYSFDVKVFGRSANPDLIRDAIVNAVTPIPGVDSVQVIQDQEPVPNLPPHSFAVVVRGGDNQEIGEAIWNKKPSGIQSYGDLDVVIQDIQGDDHVIQFQRPLSKEIYVRGNISFFTGNVPENAAEVLGQAIIDYAAGQLVPGAGFNVGEDVIFSRLFTPLNLTFQGHTINSLEISDDGVLWTIDNLVVGFNQVATFDLSRIDLDVG